MLGPAQLLTVIEYFRDDRPWKAHHTLNPTWDDVELAIRRMDNYCFPIVQLSQVGDEEDENMFNVIGGAGRYAMFQLSGEWHYDDRSGRGGRVHLWESDQGYDCKERNVATSFDQVLQIARTFYETCDYSALELLCGQA